MPVSVTLVSIAPEFSQTSVDVKSNIVLTFTGAIKAGSGQIQLRDSYGKTLFSEAMSGSRVTISGNTVTIDPPTDLPVATEITAYFTEFCLLDSTGAAVGLPYYHSFTTALNTTAQNLTGTDGDDRLHGSDLADRLDGGSGGGDELRGYGGDDILIGGDEKGIYYGDALYGGDGDDSLSGGSGNDNLRGDSGNDVLKGEADGDTLDGGLGNDLLDGGDGDDVLREVAGNNTLAGGAGNDEITVSNGDNQIDGGAGNDRIGATSRDIVVAGEGDDKISLQMLSSVRSGSADGGAGQDSFDILLRKTLDSSLTLTGGSGSDTYKLQVLTYGQGSYQCTVSDFAPGAGGDQLNLDELIYTFGAGKGNPFAASGFLALQADGADTLLVLKKDGDWPLLRLTNVAPAQLTAANFVGGYAPDGSSKGVTLTGTAGADDLRGFGLDDILTGGEGSDRLYGGDGNDMLVGGPESAADGGDTLMGDGGNDTLRGGAGNDALYGGAGNDVMEGGSGDDTLSDQDGENTLRGGAGNDSLTVGGSKFTAEGGDGDDRLSSQGGSGNLMGGNGRDTLTITGYANQTDPLRTVKAYGGEGDDRLAIEYSGLAKVDFLLDGGAGADTYVINAQPLASSWTYTISGFDLAGGDKLDLGGLLPYNFVANPFGSAGYFKLEQVGADTVVWYDKNGASNTSIVPVKLATLKGVVASRMTGSHFVNGYSPDGSNAGATLEGTAGNDTLTGTALDDKLSGYAGSDRLTGGAGDDKLYGGDEADTASGDTLDGGAGNDLLDGGAGRDVLTGGIGDDQLLGGGGDDSLRGDEGNDKLDGGAGSDNLFDHSGNNTLLGGSGDDMLSVGDSGNQRLEGGDGDDTLSCGVGVSTIHGDAGDDKIVITPGTGNTSSIKLSVAGGEGNDTITISSAYNGGTATVDASGGAGRDTYVLQSTAANSVTVRDFASGVGGDLIAVADLLPYNFKANPFGRVGYLRLKQDGVNTILQLDQDGAQGASHGWRDLLTLANTAPVAITRENFVRGYAPDGSDSGLILIGGGSNDTLQGDLLDDRLEGLGGDDLLRGGDGNDVLDGGAGADILNGGAGNDKLLGGDGNDELNDSGGSNVFDGGAGNDWIVAGAGNHAIDGGSGADTIVLSHLEFNVDPTKRFNSVAAGGDGDDVFRLLANSGVEARLTGGNGSDTYELGGIPQKNKYVITDFTAGSGGDRIDAFTLIAGGATANPFASGGVLRLQQEGTHAVLYWDPDGSGGQQHQAVLTMENVQANTLTGDNFVGGYPPDGSMNAAPIIGTEGDDILSGSRLNDTIRGAAGADRIYGSAGNDVAEGGAGNDAIQGNGGDDVLDGGLDNDSVADDQGNNTLRGGDGDDWLDSQSVGTNLLEGGSGKDVLRAGHGTDTLDGGAGDDTLELAQATNLPGLSFGRIVRANGGDGDDQFNVGLFLDGTVGLEMSGGAGADRFEFGLALPMKNTVITDFDQNGGDKLSFSEGLLLAFANLNPFAIGQLRLQQVGQDTQLIEAVNGGEQVLFSLKNVTADTLTYRAFFEGYDPRAAAAMNVSGSERSERIVAGNFADVLSGEAGNDNLYGLGGDDTLNGGDGNDRLVGGAGNDQLNGGSGIDFALMQVRSDGYKLWQENGAFRLRDLAGTYGTDILSGIERVMITGRNIALDVGADGLAGKVYRVYQAAFDRKPDAVGIGFWIAQADKGVSMTDIAQGFVGSAEFRTLYGAAPTSQELVARLYQNVLHRAGEKAGVDFWVGVLDKKAASVAEVLAAFSESAENVGNLAPVIGASFEYTPWLG